MRDGDRESPPSATARCAASSRARVYVLAAAIACSGLVAPGTARAAGPSGTDEVLGEVNAALTEAEALVPQASGTTSSSVAPADTSLAPQAVSDTGPALELAATSAAEIASSAGAPSSTEPRGPAVASPATPLPVTARSAAELRVRQAPRVTKTVRRSSSQRSTSVARSSVFLTSSEQSVIGVTVTSRASAVTGSAGIRRAPGARPTRPARAGAVPQRFPPVPLPSRDATSSGQGGGGQGPLTPLVVGALAAVLLIFAFELLRRVLPRSAFRKPRRIPLPPWHPG